LDEAHNWTMRVAELEQAVARAREQGVQPRGLVVINPGNPTGQCLEQRDMEAILDFAARHKLVLLADEVYQDNVYTHKPFVSFKKVLHGMGSQRHAVELLSFHSVSKGMLGECGKRGGYVEMTNIDAGVAEQYYKLSSIGLCPNVTGQLVVSCMVNPPRPGEPSHALYHQERDAIYQSLKRRAQLVVQQLNQLEGIQCNPAEGAMYAFPRITLPRRAIELAKSEGQAPDTWYCLQLLARTGMVVVPGSGFGQAPDTFHFRTTFLPSEESIQSVLNEFKAFHTDFMNQYRD
jgi:alanine transaminase